MDGSNRFGTFRRHTEPAIVSDETERTVRRSPGGTSHASEAVSTRWRAAVRQAVRQAGLWGLPVALVLEACGGPLWGPSGRLTVDWTNDSCRAQFAVPGEPVVTRIGRSHVLGPGTLSCAITETKNASVSLCPEHRDSVPVGEYRVAPQRRFPGCDAERRFVNVATDLFSGPFRMLEGVAGAVTVRGWPARASFPSPDGLRVHAEVRVHAVFRGP
jgi:hypothetical protein